jgi:adenylosuccinate lyase
MMENVIKELRTIEERAGETVNAVLAEKESLRERIAIEAESVKSEINLAAVREIDRLREEARAETEGKVSAAQEKGKEWIKVLEESYERNKSLWRDEIVKKIIGQ